MAIPGTRPPGNGGGGEDPGVHGDRSVGNIFEIPQQLFALSRQVGPLAPCLADSERQHAGEATTAASMWAATEVEKCRQNGREVREWPFVLRFHSSYCSHFQGKWGNWHHACQIAIGNVRGRPSPLLQYGQQLKPKRVDKKDVVRYGSRIREWGRFVCTPWQQAGLRNFVKNHEEHIIFNVVSKRYMGLNENKNYRHIARLQLQARQTRLAAKSDVFQDKKTRETNKDFAPDERLGGISSIRVTSYTEDI